MLYRALGQATAGGPQPHRAAVGALLGQPEADVAKKVLEIPDPGTRLPFSAGEKITRRRWKRCAEHAVTDYDTDATGPTWTTPAG